MIARKQVMLIHAKILEVALCCVVAIALFCSFF